MNETPNRFRWLVEFEIDETWVADGFDFDEDECQSLAESLIAWAYPSEVKVRVVEAPDPAEIRKAQGYEEVAT